MHLCELWMTGCPVGYERSVNGVAKWRFVRDCAGSLWEGKLAARFSGFNSAGEWIWFS